MAKKIKIKAARPKAPEAADVEKFVHGGEAMKRLTFDIPEDLHRKLKTRCAAEGRMMADFLRELLASRV